MEVAALLALVPDSINTIKSVVDYLNHRKNSDEEGRRKALELDESLGKMRDTISALRDERDKLQNKCEELSRQLAIQTDWKNTSDLYELVSTPGGAIVYKYKEKDILVCPTCFMDEKKTHPLQDDKTNIDGLARCMSCKSPYPVRVKSTLTVKSIRNPFSP